MNKGDEYYFKVYLSKLYGLDMSIIEKFLNEYSNSLRFIEDIINFKRFPDCIIGEYTKIYNIKHDIAKKVLDSRIKKVMHDLDISLLYKNSAYHWDNHYFSLYKGKIYTYPQIYFGIMKNCNWFSLRYEGGRFNEECKISVETAKKLLEYEYDG